MSLRMPSTLTDRQNAGVVLRYDTPHPPAAIKQYPSVAFPRPFELRAGSKLYFVGMEPSKGAK